MYGADRVVLAREDAGSASNIMLQDPGHDLQSTCGRIQMLATEIFRQGLPPPGANTELVPSMARPARGAKLF
jgi:hypothetical protein